ncbi:MAG: hypothetical protein HON90_02470 [Halobacteriovoraceae bacterium]|jgi:exopolyphosphatase / guanosine-5'-triphosphate,3'-diphosphate pyrophosphatase|nr:hypothetical protein [Halobacteriovoraceae bacterium]
MEKIAAIDIGSNAIRFTSADLVSQNEILLDEKIRIPLRLGTEAFSEAGMFSIDYIEYAQATFLEIKKVLKNLNVQRCRTVATSALRDAHNAHELIHAIESVSKIKVNTISGEQEAKLILKAIQNSNELKSSKDYLLFDLGGGSLEISIIKHGKIKGSKSFNLGTVRVLEYSKCHQTKKDLDEWLSPKIKKIKLYIEDLIYDSDSIDVIGTGGNFRRLLKLKSSSDNSKSISYPEVLEILKTLDNTSYLDRILEYDLRPDRADVIVPALKVITKVLKGLPVNNIYAPRIGLTQGVLMDMSDGETHYDQIL